MQFRLARHTTQLKPIIAFYSDILGLQVLGSFKNHDGYDGVFLGLPDLNWHLEFTVSGNIPAHHADEDDFLVFYINSECEKASIRKKCTENDICMVVAKNAYWNQNGLVIIDPDGYGVVVAIK